MLIVRGIIGAIILFLGRELNFIFAAGMAVLIGYRLAPLLPDARPGWADPAFIVGLGVIAAVLVLINERAGYYISGFLAGGYILIEFYAPGVLTVPPVPFLIGGLVGSLILGFLTEWALIVVSSVIGAIYLTNMFILSDTARTLLTGGLVIIGALVQVLIMRSQKTRSMENASLIYLHGLESDSSSGKARQFREWFPGMVAPDFKGVFVERMAQLEPILNSRNTWTIIGSSFGGLMGAVYTCDHPDRVRKLILLAPALMLDPFASRPSETIAVPTTVIHGTQDTVVPLEPVRDIAQRHFTSLTYIIMDDDHRLHKTLHELNWKSVLE